MHACKKCGEEFDTKGRLMVHSRWKHPKVGGAAQAAAGQPDGRVSMASTPPSNTASMGTSNTASMDASMPPSMDASSGPSMPPPPPPPRQISGDMDPRLAAQFADIDRSMALAGQGPLVRRQQPPPSDPPMQPQYQQEQQRQPQQQGDVLQNPWVAAGINVAMAFASAAGNVLVNKWMAPEAPDPFREIGLANYKVYTDQLSRTAGRMTGKRVSSKQDDDEQDDADAYEKATARAVGKYMDALAARQKMDREKNMPEVPSVPEFEEDIRYDDAPPRRRARKEKQPPPPPEPPPEPQPEPQPVAAAQVEEYDHTKGE